jgi:hypothetical protein
MLRKQKSGLVGFDAIQLCSKAWISFINNGQDAR